MKSLSGVGLGLSLVFGFLLLAFVAELYYLIWWKKRIANSEVQEDYRGPASTEFLFKLCWNKSPSFCPSLALKPRELCSSVRIKDTHIQGRNVGVHHLSKDLRTSNSFAQNVEQVELVRFQSLSARAQRFLSPIVEETMEDLESTDGKSRGEKSGKGSRSRSLSDVLLTAETPFFTPLASPPYFTPPMTPPLNSSNSQRGLEFDFSLTESPPDSQFCITDSPIRPKFKFLRDADEKLQRQKVNGETETQEIRRSDASSSLPNGVFLNDEENGSYITLTFS